MRVRNLALAAGVAGALLSLSSTLHADPALSVTSAAFPTELSSLTAPGDTDSLYARAGRLYAERRFRDAIPLFLQVVQLDPRNGNAYALLGGSYLQLGDYPQAIGAFERSLELDEGIKLAYLGLVASNYFTERMESSRQWVRRLVPLLTGDERDRYLAMFSAQFPRLDLSGT